MFLVVEGGHGSGLGDGIDVERLPDLLERGDDFRRRDSVTEAQAGKAEDLREGPHKDEVLHLAVADERDKVHRVVQELDVGLVHHEEHVLGNAVHQFHDLGAAGERAGRVVRIRHEHHAGLRRDGLHHGLEVMAEVPGGNGDEVRAEQAGDDRIDGEAILRDDDVNPRAHERVADELDDLVGSVAEDEVGRRGGEFRGELLLQVEGVSIRVEMEILEDMLHRGEGLGRGA